MSLQDTDWKAEARVFCKHNNTLDVSVVEKAMRHGAAVAVTEISERLRCVSEDMRQKRIRANRPQ